METRAKKKTLPIILASLLCAVLAIFGLSNLSVFTSNRVKAADAEVGTEAELTNALSNGSNVKFTADVTLENVLVVGKDTVIDLNGKTLTAKAFDKYTLSNDKCYTGLVVNGSATVTIKNGTLTSAYLTASASYSGYVILADDSSALTLDNVSVIGQNASETAGTRASGGIMYDSTGSLTLVGSKVVSGDTKGLNLNYNSAAAIQTKPGCGGSIVISSSEIYGGKGAGSVSATDGISLYGSASLEIINSSVNGGDAEKTGGKSVYVSGNGTVKIIDSEICGGNSTAGIGGDSLYVNSADCEKVTVTGSTVAGGNGGTSWDGAGIYFSKNVDLEVTDSSVKSGAGENATGNAAAIKFNDMSDGKNVTLGGVTLTASNGSKVIKNGGSTTINVTDSLTIIDGALENVTVKVADGAKVSAAGNVTIASTAEITTASGSAVVPEKIAAKVGDTYYSDLTSAFAALNGVNYTLELLSDSEWDSATPVYYKSGAAEGYSATLVDALTAAYKANEDDIVIVCRPGADVGTMIHGHVEDNLVIYGNDAYISGGECDLEVDTFIFSRETGRQAVSGDYLTKDVAITAYELDNLGVWGQRHTDFTVTVTLNDCDGKEIAGRENVQRVYISGNTGKNVIAVNGCDFITGKTAVYSNADGSVTVENCSFTGSASPVNVNHKADGEITLTVKNSSFDGCGDDGEWASFAAPVRFVNSGNGSLTSTVESCSFENTVGANGDILLGDGRENQKSNDVALTVINTEANVTAQKPGYYDVSGAVIDDTLAGTKVSPAEGTLETTVEQLAGRGSEAVPYTLDEFSSMTREEYIAAQERLGGTIYVDLGAYSYDKNGVLGNGTTSNSDKDLTKLNCYGQNGYLGDKNDGANGKNVVFIGTSVSNSVTGYQTIDGTGTSLVLAVPAYTNVTFKGIEFNGVFTFAYQLYTSPWSQLGELKFDGCTFNGLIVGAVATQKLNFTGCEFTAFTNSVSANNSNPIWVRPAYGNWTAGDNEGQGDSFRSLTSIVFENNTVASTRPVKFERIAQWEVATKVEVKGNSFDITDDGSNKNVGLYFGANAKFDLVIDENTKSEGTAALYTAVYSAPDNKSYAGLPAGSTVKNTAGENVTSSDALAWKTTDEITLGTTNEDFSVNGKVNFATLQEAINAAADNGVITVLQDTTVSGKVIFPAGKTLTFDLNGKKVTALGDVQGFWANVEGTVTFTGSGYLGDETHNSVGYLIYLVGSLTIEGDATYESGLTVVQVSAAGANLVINGGNHIGDAYDGKYWTINIIDRFEKDVTVAINGGTFYNFDPRNCKTEGEGTNFLAPEAGVDYVADGENSSFTVKPNMAVQIVDADGNSVKAYATLKEAVAAGKDGEVLKLLKNIDLDEQIELSKAITIDGDGKYEIKATKNIVGTSSGKRGMFYRVTYAKGTLTFKNVTLNGNGVSKIFLNEGGAGETVFDGVTSQNGGGIEYGSGIHISGGGSHATIKNSTLTGSAGTMELSETNYYAANDLWVGGNVDVVVENSTIGTVFVNSTSTLTARHGHLVIQGENTQINYLSGEYEGGADKEGNLSSVTTITDGYVGTIFDKGTYVISGGTFGTEIKPEWCAEGFAPKANGDGTYGVREAVYIARVNGVGYETLKEAIDAAADGETVIASAGEYKIPGTSYTGKTITIKAADGAEVSFDMSAAIAIHGAKIIFEDVTFDYKTNGNYIGLQHASELTYNNCKINGQAFLYATTETFNNCTFTQESAGSYNVWTYGAKNVTFNECVFNCVGKSVLLYNEGTNDGTDLTVTKTTFNASAPVAGKAAIEIDTSLMSGGSEITVDGETTATGFANGSNSGNSLWNDKKQTVETNKNVTVTVDDEVVYTPVVAKINDKYYATVAEAINEANDGDVVILIKDVEADVVLTVNKAITVDLNGKTLTNNAVTSAYTLVTNAAVTLKNGTYKSTNSGARAIGANANLTLSGVTVESAGLVGVAFSGNGGVYTVENSTLKGGYAIASFADNSTINITDGVIEARACGIYHNGTYKNLTLNVKDTSIIAGSEEVSEANDDTTGVLISGQSVNGLHNVKFEGSTVKGGTAVEVKYTNLTVIDCEITATASKVEYVQNNNGGTSRGFALVSTDNAKGSETPAPSGTIKISGNSKFSGIVGLGNSAAVKEAYADLTDANYEISGGTFSSAIGDDYFVNGYKAEKDSDGIYKVVGAIEVWTGFSASDKVALFDSIADAMAYVLTLGEGVTRRVVVNGNYVLASDVTIAANAYLDVLGTLTVGEGVTINVADGSKRLGVWAGAKVINNGTIIILGEECKVMLQSGSEFEGNEVSVPEGWWRYINSNAYMAINIATAAVKVEYKDGSFGYFNSNIPLTNAAKVTLLRDFDGTLSFTGTSSNPFDVVIDLNGHTISKGDSVGAIITVQNGKFVIKNGTVKSFSTSDGNNKPALNIRSNAEVTVESDVVLDGGTNHPAVYLEGGSLTLYGTAKTEGSLAITTQGLNEHETLVTIKDGATVTANNGIAIYNPRGELVIEGGNITGKTGVQICSGKLTISGGTITATGADESAGCTNAVFDGAAVSILNRNYPGGIPSVTITGGTFKSETEAAIRAYDWTNDVKADWPEAKDHVSVSGGKFSSIPENMLDLCKDGFVPVKNSDGTYSVVAGSYIAKIGEEMYISLEDALKAAVSGDTVVLLADITTSGTTGIEVRVKGGITLDLNGHSIDGTSVSAKNSALKLTATERVDSSIAIVNNAATESVITGILPVKITNGNYDLKLTVGANVRLNVIGNGNAVFLDKCVYMDNTDANAAYFKEGGFKATKNGVTRIYERLSSAVNYGESVMMNDYTTDSYLNVWSSWGTPVLDLGGKTYTYTGSSNAFDLYDGGANITIKNGKIITSGRCAIALTESNQTLTLIGVEIEANGDYGIVTNGSYVNENITIENSKITAGNGMGVYFPSTGSLTIVDSEITGKVGVQICAGSLSISGSETVITGNGTAETAEASGSVIDGAAVSIISRNGYGALTSVSISGGKFVSEHGTALKAYALDGTTESAFDNTDKVIVITGGKYNAIPEYMSDLCASGYRPAITKEGVYEIVEKQLAVSATLGEDISLNYYVKKKTDNTKVTVKYVKNGETVEEVLTEFVATTGKYAGRFVFRGITPQMLDRGITVMYEDGETKDAIENYSVADYLIKVAANSANSEKAKRLASDTLYYGIAAMKYVGTETLKANAEALQARVTELGITQSVVEMVDTSVSEVTEKIVGVTVMFDNKNSLVFRVKDEVYEQKIGYRYYLSSKKFTKWDVTSVPGYHAYISEPIKATGIIGNKITFEVTDGLNFVQKVSYDIASYCAKIYATSSASEQLKELAKATYCYGYSALQYANA